jgi:hypothetical protein
MRGSQFWLPPTFSRRLEFLHFQPSSKPTGSASGLAGSAGGLAAGVLLVVCGKQNGEYALDCGAANPGCRRLSAGAGDQRLAHLRKSRLKGGWVSAKQKPEVQNGNSGLN